jgi:arylsulfatase A-like enzyme
MYNYIFITTILASVSIVYIYNNIIYLPGILYKLRNPILSGKNIEWKYKKNVTNNDNNKPNIILIIVDDMGINDLSIHTPNINSIYKNGANFINAYSGHATCAPSRVSIFTGMFPTNIGFEFTPIPKNFIRLAYYLENQQIRPSIIDMNKLNNLIPMEKMVLPLNYTLISNELHNYGYYNYFLGKWHIGEVKGYTPLDRGYDESLAFLYGASMYGDIKNKSIISSFNENSIFDKLLNKNLPFSISYNNGPRFKPNEYMTDYLTNNAIKIIDINKNITSPFFITLAYNAPHNPYQALLSDYNSPEFIHLEHNDRVYYSMIKAIDRGIGKIIESLKKNNKYNDTIIIFTSDNGGAHYSNIKETNKPYKGFKSTFFEGGIRVPLFIQYPKLIPKNSLYTKLSHHIDIYSTITSLINIKNTRTLDGINLFNEKEKHKILFWKSCNYICIRYNNWKLSLSENPNKIWLYDLKEDPNENNNLLNNLNIKDIYYLSQNYNNYSIYYTKNKLYKLLLKYNNTAKPPLWNSVIKISIPIEKNKIVDNSDEYVYWAN